MPNIQIRGSLGAVLLLAAAAICAIISGCALTEDGGNYTLFANPLGLTFDVAAGSSTTAQVTFFGTATMTGVTLSGANANLFSVPEGSCVGVTTSPNSHGCVVVVTFSPKNPGAYAGVLTGNSNNGTAMVPLTAQANAP